MDNQKVTDAQPRDYTDLLIFLAARPTLLSTSATGIITLASGENRKKVRASDVANLAAKGLLARTGKQLMLSNAGRQLLAIGARTADVAIVLRVHGKDSHIVAVNMEESPLIGLARRKATDGSNFLSQSQFDAGERIREDFTRAMLMPRTTTNWEAAVTSDRQIGGESGIEDFTNSVVGARTRFDGAIKALAGDLSGVVVDICCFLKGFEQVERERGWPKRSAKFILKAALAVLATHYWPQNTTIKQRTRHWGTEGYRPSVS
jgi:Domain of unknown function (DUF6456)